MQDFLKEVDLQFLDHMRRGTSINFADLASDPPPASMQVSMTAFTSAFPFREGDSRQDVACIGLASP